MENFFQIIEKMLTPLSSLSTSTLRPPNENRITSKKTNRKAIMDVLPHYDLQPYEAPIER